MIKSLVAALLVTGTYSLSIPQADLAALQERSSPNPSAEVSAIIGATNQLASDPAFQHVEQQLADGNGLSPAQKSSVAAAAQTNLDSLLGKYFSTIPNWQSYVHTNTAGHFAIQPRSEQDNGGNIGGVPVRNGGSAANGPAGGNGANGPAGGNGGNSFNGAPTSSPPASSNSNNNNDDIRNQILSAQAAASRALAASRASAAGSGSPSTSAPINSPQVITRQGSPQQTGPAGNIAGTRTGLMVLAPSPSSSQTGPAGNIAGSQTGLVVVPNHPSQTGPAGNIAGTQSGLVLLPNSPSSSPTSPAGNIAGSQTGLVLLGPAPGPSTVTTTTTPPAPVTVVVTASPPPATSSSGGLMANLGGLAAGLLGVGGSNSGNSGNSAGGVVTVTAPFNAEATTITMGAVANNGAITLTITPGALFPKSTSAEVNSAAPSSAAPLFAASLVGLILPMLLF